MAIDLTQFGAFGQAAWELLVILLSIVVPAALIAFVAYCVIRMAVRDGVLDARLRCGEPIPEESTKIDPVVSSGRKLLYRTGAVFLVLGLLMLVMNAAYGPFIALAGFALIVAYVILFAIDAVKKPRG